MDGWVQARKSPLGMNWTVTVSPCIGDPPHPADGQKHFPFPSSQCCIPRLLPVCSRNCSDKMESVSTDSSAIT